MKSKKRVTATSLPTGGLDFEMVRDAIRAAPVTQIPAIMTACIKAGIEKEVWRPYWISIFVDRIERELRQKE